MIADDDDVEPAPGAGPLSTQTTDRPLRDRNADHPGADDDRVGGRALGQC
jgi:hypothetical protein